MKTVFRKKIVSEDVVLQCYRILNFLRSKMAEKSYTMWREAEINSFKNLCKLFENQQFEYGYLENVINIVVLP